MSDTQEDARLVDTANPCLVCKPALRGTCESLGQCDTRDAWRKVERRLVACEALGSVEYLAALVEEHGRGVCPTCHRRELLVMFDTDTATKFPCTLGRKQYQACGKQIGMCRSGCPHSRTVAVACADAFHAAHDKAEALRG